MESFNAAFLIIGNEILSGRTTEKNLSVLAHLLGARGWRLAEARVVPDEREEIVDALNALRRRWAHVFTSGGIGPTHDDITTDCIAAALELPVRELPAALEALTASCRAQGVPLTPARRRMARAPQGAEPVISEFSGPPAYAIENITVCAGVPSIFALMAAAAVARLPAGVVRRARAVRVLAGESGFAEALADVARRFAAVEIGSYPRHENGAPVCQVVFTAADEEAREEALRCFCEFLQAENLPFEEI